MIIPAILAKSQKEFEEKIKKILPFSDFIQIDVMDGVFVPNTTWADTDVIEHLHLPARFEAHLMVKNPEAGVIEEWAKAGAARIIFHIEATKKPEQCIKQIKKYKKEIGIAINPKTPLAKLKPFLKTSDYVLVMGVTPGFSGQKFQPVALEKIKQLKKIAPRVKIGVDGGVNKTNAKKIYAAGADYLNAASAIFKAKNIAKAIEELNDK
ncbi:MAG: ribulose-phosphate 3-epimerase [bacterium]